LQDSWYIDEVNLHVSFMNRHVLKPDKRRKKWLNNHYEVNTGWAGTYYDICAASNGMLLDGNNIYSQRPLVFHRIGVFGTMQA